ncbi:MAG TPA: large conductance mechanosensitive channel protein MscL [Candidatus Copromorpha excrementigallinarum]|uniref:Large-conductance mechanosensitive channel n=1 Tax=Candidatus Allocopromorpha excrementigallinarum TaxID=2840742 RepID=A0A9D1I2K1_9FIRM|nr:large conductance mechanosensitive channel protein MscL [Candidatus Copromorpha excrementigallinarum]
MKKFFNEFKEFAMRGNVLDLAVGIIIGAAFTAIVTSLVDDILSPVIGLLVQVNFSDLAVSIGGVTLKYGSFIMAVINFVIVAFALFVLIKAVNTAMSLGRKKEEEQPTTKECPYCKSEINIEATRCPNCTSVLPEEEKEEVSELQADN